MVDVCVLGEVMSLRELGGGGVMVATGEKGLLMGGERAAGMGMEEGLKGVERSEGVELNLGDGGESLVGQEDGDRKEVEEQRAEGEYTDASLTFEPESLLPPPAGELTSRPEYGQPADTHSDWSHSNAEWADLSTTLQENLSDIQTFLQEDRTGPQNTTPITVPSTQLSAEGAGARSENAKDAKDSTENPEPANKMTDSTQLLEQINSDQKYESGAEPPKKMSRTSRRTGTGRERQSSSKSRSTHRMGGSLTLRGRKQSSACTNLEQKVLDNPTILSTALSKEWDGEIVNVAGRGPLRKLAKGKLEYHAGCKLRVAHQNSDKAAGIHTTDEGGRSAPWFAHTVEYEQVQTASKPSMKLSPETRPTTRESRDEINTGLPSNSSRLSNHGKKRLVWTPALHDRFIEAVNMAGYENPGPKTILELMNVEGLTTEHVKSHLQKFRNNIRKAKTDEPEGISPHEASSFNESACYQNTTPPTAVTTTDTRCAPQQTRVIAQQQMEIQLELQERTMRLQLQLQMVVHKTVSLQRKVQLALEKVSSTMKTNPVLFHPDSDQALEHSQLSRERREILAELANQQQLLQQQMEEQEELRRELIKGSDLCQ